MMRVFRVVVALALVLLLSSTASALVAVDRVAVDRVVEPFAVESVAGGAPVHEGMAADIGSSYGGPRAESLAPDARNAVVVLEDPEGDVSYGSGSNPVTTEDAHVDIVSLTLLETDEAILFQLRHRDYPEPQDLLGFLLGGSFWYYVCWLQFEDRSTGMAYSIVTFSRYASTTTIYSLGAELSSGEFIAFLPVALVAEERIEILLPKQLFGAGDPAKGLRVGTALSGFEVDCGSGSWLLPGGVYDVATNAVANFQPDTAPHHELFGAQFRALDQILKYSSSDAPSDPHYSRLVLAAPPDSVRESRVRLFAHGLEGSRNITASAVVVDAAGEPADGWTASIPERVRLSPGGERSVPILVTIPPAATHGEERYLVVKFTAGEATALVMRPVRAVLDPGPARPTLFFHGDATQGFVLNTLAQDSSRSQGTTDETNGIGGYLSVRAEMDAPFATSQSLVGSERLHVTVVLSAEKATERWVDVQLRVPGGVTIGWGYASAVIGPGPTPVEVRFDADVYDHRFEAGDRLVVDIYSGSYDLAGFLTELVEERPVFHAAGSRIDLPFAAQRTSTGLVRMSLNEGNGHFITSIAHRQAVTFQVRNLDMAWLDLELDSADSPGDWKFRFVPGDKLRLGPDEERTMCVEITAPRELTAEEVPLTLGAWGGEELGRVGRLPLAFHVAEGVSLEGSRCAAQGTSVQSDSEPVKGAPGVTAPGVALLVLLGVGTVAWRRRLSICSS